MWEENAKKVKDVYGGYVDWDERVYICPYCQEPISEDDWTNEELSNFLCPICEDIDEEE